MTKAPIWREGTIQQVWRSARKWTARTGGWKLEVSGGDKLRGSLNGNWMFFATHKDGRTLNSLWWEKGGYPTKEAAQQRAIEFSQNPELAAQHVMDR
jgi:hypothetical protein